MMLTYHQRTAALLNRQLTLSLPALAQLEERERDLGVLLPASVREWYSLYGAVEILAEHSNTDHPVPLAEFGAPVRDWGGRGSQEDLVADRLLLIMVECQSVAQWAVRLDGSDDPPVVVRVSDDKAPDWRPCADRFSTFVYAQVWDYSGVFEGLRSEEYGCLLQADDRPLTADDLALLRQRFTEEPRTYGWPTPTTYRFSTGNARILVWNDEERASWYLAAASVDGTTRLIHELRQYGLLSGELYAFDDCGEEVLANLRR